MNPSTFFLSGTDTDVGKTVISAAILLALKHRGHDVSYFKPVLSGARLEAGRLIPGDTEFVAQTAELLDSERLYNPAAIADLMLAYQEMTPYVYEEALSPHLAAKRVQQPIDPQRIQTQLERLQKSSSVVLVEGAGGIACPLIETSNDFYMTADLIKACDLPVLLVCRASLGTLNHTLTAVSYAKQQGLTLHGLIINGYEDTPACEDNLQALPKLTGLPILAIMPKLNAHGNTDLQEAIRQEILKPGVAATWVNAIYGQSPTQNSNQEDSTFE